MKSYLEQHTVLPVPTNLSYRTRTEQILRMSEKEQEQLIAARKLEDARLREIEAQKRKEEVHNHVRVLGDDTVVGFDYNKIPAYLTHGLWVDNLHYQVAAPEITTPHYLSLTAASSYLFDNLGSETVHVFNKWDGEKIQLMLLTDELGNKDAGLILFRDVVKFVPYGMIPCQLELMEFEPKCVAGEVDGIMTEPIHVFELHPQADGAIISTDLADYRVKTERTYDLRVREGRLTDKEGKVYGYTDKSEGKIVETTHAFEVKKERPDKKEPLTTAQVEQVTRSVVLGALPKFREVAPHMTYETVVTATFRVAANLLKEELFWTQDAVAANMAYPAHYSKEEIFSTLKPHLGCPVNKLERVEGPLGVRRVGSTLIFSEPPLRKLTLIDYLEKASTSKSLSMLKRDLIQSGRVFTPADFRVLREVFFRGYKSTFVLNVGYKALCRELDILQTVQAEGDSDLPYIGKAQYNVIVRVGETSLISPFRGGIPRLSPMTFDDLASLPREVYYSDLMSLAARTRKGYDVSSVGVILGLMGKQLIGARPWRIPALEEMKLYVQGSILISALSERVNVPVPHLVAYLEENLDVFEFIPGNRVRLR